MAIKSTKVQVTGPAPKSKKPTIPVVLVKDDPLLKESLVADYNRAAAREKAAAAEKAEIAPKLKELGLPVLYDHNGTKGNEVIASVKLVQQRVNEDGEPLEPDGNEAVLGLQFKSSYSAVDAAKADAAFTEAFPAHDINEYVVESVVGSFDHTIWMKEDGTVNRRIYKRIMDAMAEAVEDLDLRDEAGNLRTPLATRKVVQPRPTFHQQRWEDFTIEEQKKLSEIFPNTVALAPARTK